MSCERVEELIRKIALGFIMLFLSGFLVIYYAIRKLACASTGLCSSAHWPEPSIGSVDMLVMIFVVSVVFFSVLWYFSWRNMGGSDEA